MNSTFLSEARVLTDEESMVLVQNDDDHRAFARLMERWQAPIHRLCSQMIGDAHVAQDLSQETFAAAFVKRKQFRPGAKFSTWLWRIALNLCYSRLRRAQWRLDRQFCQRNGSAFAASDMELVSQEAPPDQRMVAQEAVGLVRQALLILPESLRSVLILRYCEGLKLREVAEKLQVPETTAASRCAVGLARLTKILEKNFKV